MFSEKKKIDASGAKLHFLKALYVDLLKILYFLISTIGAEIPVKNESFSEENIKLVCFKLHEKIL